MTAIPMDYRPIGGFTLQERWIMASNRLLSRARRGTLFAWNKFCDLHDYFLRQDKVVIQYAGAAGSHLGRYLVDQYAREYPQSYAKFRRWNQGMAGAWRGNEGVLATTSVNLGGLANVYNYMSSTGAIHSLSVVAAASRFVVIGGMQISSLLGIGASAAFLTWLAPVVIAGSIALGIIGAINLLRNPEASFGNKAMAFGAAALAVTSFIPGLGFVPLVSKAFGAVALAKQFHTLFRKEGQWWSEASTWQKTLMFGSMVAGTAILIPTILGVGGWLGHARVPKTSLITSANVSPEPANLVTHSYAAPVPHLNNTVSSHDYTTPSASEPLYASPFTDHSPYRETSGYGERIDPWSGHIRPHYGYDYAAPYGTDVPAVDGGHVIYAGHCRGFGHNYVAVQFDTPYGKVTEEYGHMERMFVHTGEEIHRGQLVGLVGSEGRSTGAHLHFGTRLGGLHGHHVDPFGIASIRRHFEQTILGRHAVPSALAMS